MLKINLDNYRRIHIYQTISRTIKPPVQLLQLINNHNKTITKTRAIVRKYKILF